MPNLERFLEAQERAYETDLAEVRAGRKQSHWIWYVFQQVLDKFFDGKPDGKTLEIIGL